MPTTKTVVSSLLICSAIAIWAASPSIGFVVAKGSFQLDNSRIWDNATLFDGSVIETKVVPSQIHLSNRSDIQVAAESRVIVFQSRAVLEKGAVRLQSSTGYQVEARALQLSAAASNTIAVVELRANGQVAASASGGEILITNKERVLVAHVTPGKTVTLDPDDASTPALTQVSGCVQGSRHGVSLVDEASGVAFELHGGGVEKEVGNMVKITGTAENLSPKAAGASQAIKVVHSDRVGVCLAVATASRRTRPIRTTAIIGGVAVAGTLTGLEAAGAFAPAQREAQPATSR